MDSLGNKKHIDSQSAQPVSKEIIDQIMMKIDQIKSNKFYNED